RDQAQRLLRTQPSWFLITLRTPDGRAVVDTRRPVGSDLPATTDPVSLTQLKATLQPVVGSINQGPPPDRRMAFPIRVPVMRNGELLYVLSAIMTPDALGEVLRRQQAVSDEWVRGIVDEKGVIAARSRDAERFVGRKAPASFLQRFGKQDEGVYRDVSLDN